MDPASSDPTRPLWHVLPAADATQVVQTDPARGLTPEAAGERLARFGANALPDPRRRTLAAVVAGQLRSPLIYLLLVAAAVALALGHTSDAIVIAVVVALNSVVGAAQEGRAERALAALRTLATRRARVIRGGTEQIVAAREVVPGDVLVVEAGDAIAADARLLDGSALQIAEAPLTGESVPVAKDVHPVAADTPLAERSNMIYAGTHVTAGRARAVVVATGRGTELGRIAALAERATPGKTPLERRVARFGRSISGAAVVAFVGVVAIGYWRELPIGQVLMIGISQLVGVIPEGLPVAMTVALAIGVQRMARRGALVRRLSAVETLGSTTLICTDKTGTLTRNEMTATHLGLPDGRRLEVSGIGYAPHGGFAEVTAAGARAIDPAVDRAVRELLEAGALCNDAALTGPHDTEPTWRPVGDPTEVALVALAIKGGVVPAALRARYPRRAEIPFDPAAKLMATQHRWDASNAVIIKGAPEAVLSLCSAARRGTETVPLDDRARGEIERSVHRMAEAALRVLAVAIVENAVVDGQRGFEGFRDRATLLGLVGQLDPPRLEVGAAVERCRAAGIRPVMVTGDHKSTGLAIARSLGVAREGDLALDGSELDALSDPELLAHAQRVSVFARVHPAQKLRIVEMFQRAGEVVAMTGDGVNDAPALAKADVGVAMGVTGTEVAKEAAKIVISDDNFATIVAAIEEGRVAYQNIKKAVILLFSTSAAEVLVLSLAMLLGYPPPFAAVQILWNNLVTEGVITVNLVTEPAEGDEMRRAPVPRDEPLVTPGLMSRMTLMVAAMVLSTLGWFVARTAQGISEEQIRTETFTLLAVCEWFNVLNCRSAHRSALSFDLLRNRWLLAGLLVGNVLQLAVVFWAPLGRVFHTVPFGFAVFLSLGAVGSSVLWVEEVRKLLARRRARSSPTPPI